MALWTDVSFQTGDETQTITRNSSASESSLFVEIHTTAIIKSESEEIYVYPSLCSASARKRTCIAVDNQIHVFNESCTELRSSLCTDSKVDSIALNEEGDFLLVGEANGDITLIYLPLVLKLFNQNIVNPSNYEYSYCNVMLVPSAELDTDIYDVILLAYNGNVYQLKHLNLNEVKKAITDQDIEKATLLQSSCHFSLEYTDENDAATARDGLIIRNANEDLSLLSMGAADRVVRIQSLSEEKNNFVFNVEIDGTGVRKAVLSSNGMYILALDSNNFLNVISRETFITVKIWNDFEISDFSLLDPGFAADSLSECEDKLAVVTKAVDGQSHFKIYSFPSLKPMYSTMVSSVCHVVASNINQEAVILIDGHQCHEERKGTVQSLAIKSIYEVMPETRLARLLRKKRFEEAESFAKQFGFDLQIVYNTVLNYLLDVMTPKQLSNLNDLQYEELQQQFRKYLSKLSDLRQVVHCCLQIQLPTPGATRDFLVFVKSQLKDKGSDHLAKINGIIFKLQTFELVFGENCFRELWFQFSKRKMEEEILKRLKLNELKTAFDLWLRHEGEVIKKLNSEYIRQLLEAIPESVHSVLLLNWLRRNFFPLALKVVPKSLNVISAWVSERAKSLELSTKDTWPVCALEFAKLLPDAVANVQKKCCRRGGGANFFYEMAQQQARGNSSDFNQLCLLIRNMEDLQKLKLDYKCTITLSDYLQDDKEVVSFQLLDWMCSAEEITRFINGFLKEFLVLHQLSIDEVLCHYVMDCLTTVGQGHWYWDQTNLEERLIVIIKNISSTEEVCCAVLELSSYAPVPWSDQVHQAVADALKLDHPYVFNIKEQVRLLDIKLLLLKYELHGFNIAEAQLAEPLVHFILNQAKPDALNDALKVAHVYKNSLEECDVYLSRMRSLINDNQVTAAVELLKAVPKEINVVCCKRLIFHTISLLAITDCWAEEKPKTYYTLASLEAIEILSSLIDSHIFDEFCILRKNLERLYILQIQFELFLSLDELENSGEDILNEAIDAFLGHYDAHVKPPEEDVQGDDFLETKLYKKVNVYMNVISAVIRLAELLGISEDVTLAKLAKQAAMVGNVSVVADVSRELQQNAIHSTNIEQLGQIASSLLQQESKSVAVTNQVVQELSGTTVTYCASENIPLCLQLTSWTSFMRNLYEMDKTRNESLLSRSRAFRTYEEIGLPLDTSVLTTASCTLLTHFGSLLRDNAMSGLFTGGKLVEYLQQRGYSLLALQALLTLLGNFQTVLDTPNDNKKLDPSAAVILHTCIDVKNRLAHRILLTVLTQKCMDYQLAVCLALNMHRDLAVSGFEDAVKRSDSNYAHLLRVQRLALDLAIFWGDDNLCLQFSSQIIRVSWGLRLSKYKISFRDALHECGKEEVLKVLQEIVRHPDIEPGLVEDYCLAFDLNVQESLINYLEALLASCNNSLSNGLSSLVHLPTKHFDDFQGISLKQHISADHIQSVCPYDKSHEVDIDIGLSRVNATIHMIIDKKILLRTMKLLLKQVSPYNYKLIIFLLGHCLSITPPEKTKDVNKLKQGIELMKFLQAYCQIRKPDDQDRTENKVMTDHCNKKLPFHSLMYEDPWTIIMPELEFESVMTWLGVTNLLQLSSDVMLFTTVQIEMERLLPLLKTASVNDKKLTNFLLPFLEKAHGLILLMEDQSKAVACAKWITERLPLGPDKVHSAQWTIQLAEGWYKGCGPDKQQTAKEACKKLSEFAQRLVTEQVLNEDNLNSAELHSLIPSPTKLIIQLYELHTSYNSTLWAKPYADIHSAAEKIATANNVNLQKIHKTLVEKWLTPEAMCSLDESYSESPRRLISSNYCEQDEHNFQRAVYILQYGSTEENIMWLLRIARKESSHISYAVKYRSLRCLFSIADHPTIEKLSRQSIEELRQLMQSFQYLSQLEELRLPSSIDLFHLGQMHELAEGIWKRHKNDVRVIRLMAKLFMESETESNLSLWESILSQMVQFSMVEELDEVLCHLSSVISVWDFKSFADAWTLILTDPFLRGAELPTDVIRERYIDVCVKLYRCPIQMDNVLPALCDQFLEVGYPALGLGCLLHISDENRRRKSLEAAINVNFLKEVSENLSEMKSKKDYFPQQLQVENYLCQYNKMLEE